MEQSRRSFLTGIAGVAGSALSLSMAGRTASAAPEPASLNISGSSRRSFLEIEDQILGPLVEFSGGSLVADVEETLSNDNAFFTKRPITPRISPLEFTTNIGMNVAFWQRVGAILSHSQVPFRGAIVRTDINLNIRQRVEFTQAVFSEASVGALDVFAATTDTQFNFKLDVGNLSRSVGSGTVPSPVAVPKKKSSIGNFKLSIDKIQGLESIFAIDSFGIVQPVTRDPGGAPIFGPLETSPLTIKIPERAIDDFYDWFQNLAIEGDSTDERVGTLVGVSNDLKSVLWSVRFFNLGVFAVRPDVVRPTQGRPPTVHVSMYFERAFVTLGPIIDL
jgi:hypothetical protein